MVAAALHIHANRPALDDAILDLMAHPSVSFIRVPYDIAAVTQKIRSSELPHEFAADLEVGGVLPVERR